MRLAGKKLQSLLAMQVEPLSMSSSSRAADDARRHDRVGQRSGKCRRDWHRVYGLQKRSLAKRTQFRISLAKAKRVLEKESKAEALACVGAFRNAKLNLSNVTS
eukprot:6209638-Pleurochrysis_carterae.AAC.1